MTSTLRATLDEDVPLLGGRPRDLVAHDDGRRRGLPAVSDAIR